MFSEVFIIGLGLIGGSLALDIRERKLSSKIVGYDSNQFHLKEAKKLGLIDKVSQLQAATSSDLVILSVPVSQIPKIYKKIAPYLNKKAIVIDTGSVKEYVINQISKIENSKQFVPCHPIAGTEKNGPMAAKIGLFRNKNVIITADKAINRAKKVAKLWKAVGSKVVFMDARMHDEIFATVSHLPHAAAYSLIDSTLVNGNLPRYIGGGLADFTRIAASSPSMWSDIFIYNKNNIINAISKYERSLNHLKDCIVTETGLFEFLSIARDAKLKSAESNQTIITIDGPSGVGKSSVSQYIAKKLGFSYIDSGALYRARAVFKKIDSKMLKFRYIDGRWLLYYGEKNIESSIRGEKAAIAASNIAKDLKIREDINDTIYKMVGRNSAVVEGRDAGTAIFPNANLKLFLDAPLDLRIARRVNDDSSATAKQLSYRDAQDSSRAVSPLSMATDAIYLDTSASFDIVIKMINSIIRNILKISVS